VHGLPASEFIHGFVPVSITAPSLRVDTSDGYVPSLQAIAAFASGAGQDGF
jgi:hypothetical protein